MKTCCYCLRSKCCVYTYLILKILIDLLFLSVLAIICYNITLLKFYQIIYLILCIIFWIVIAFYSIYKLFLILFGKFSFENASSKNWRIVHFPSYILILIGLIYDAIIIPFKSGSGGWLMYFFIFFVFTIIYLILCNLDYFGAKAQLEISQKKQNSYRLHEEKKTTIEINQSTTTMK